MFNLQLIHNSYTIAGVRSSSTSPLRLAGGYMLVCPFDEHPVKMKSPK